MLSPMEPSMGSAKSNFGFEFRHRQCLLEVPRYPTNLSKSLSELDGNFYCSNMAIRRQVGG